MVEDLGVEAKEAAVREVAKLLPLPELLQSIASIKADYIARQQVLSPRYAFRDSILLKTVYAVMMLSIKFILLDVSNFTETCVFSEAIGLDMKILD